MGEKVFTDIGDRKQLHELLPLPGIETQLFNQCKVLEDRIKNKQFIHPEKWTPANTRKAIKDITGQKPDHMIETRKHDPGPHYKGLYAWVDGKGEVQYVGISQNLDTRIPHHVTQKNRSIATWAYIMSKHNANGVDIKIPGSYDFKDREKYQAQIRDHYRCTVVLESNDYLLYMLEAYASICFRAYWNLFHTH